MNEKTAKKLRKITLAQYGATDKFKPVYRALKKNYNNIPKPQRQQFKKNLELLMANIQNSK
jgi:hypothetical protein